MKHKDNVSNTKPRVRAFSLIELQIAIVLITIFLLSTAQLLILSRSIQYRYKDHILIMGMISEKLEHFRSMPFDSPEAAVGSYTEEQTEMDTARVFRIDWTISDISPRLKSVDISCFPEGYEKRETRAIVYLSSDLGF
jgi:Tfp pilus assembly protein PilV